MSEPIKPADLLSKAEKFFVDHPITIIAALLAAYFPFVGAKIQAQATVEAATETARQGVLDSYLSRTKDLVAENQLSNNTISKQQRDLFQSYGFTALRNLDGQRKGYLIRFLDEYALIEDNTPVISLSGADLRSINLQNAWLPDINLEGTYMMEGNLKNTNLKRASLRQADLRGANLARADLTDADLTGANLTNTQMSDAILCRTTLPDGSVSNEGCQ